MLMLILADVIVYLCFIVVVFVFKGVVVRFYGHDNPNAIAIFSYVPKQAHQRSSLKWLLSKAFNNQVPDNLKDPFYRDHEGIDHIKPQIVVGLGNASLYCQTLSNLYSDPNYQSLNHWSLLQTLTRKGIALAETADVQLTETALIQTNPLRIVSVLGCR